MWEQKIRKPTETISQITFSINKTCFNNRKSSKIWHQTHQHSKFLTREQIENQMKHRTLQN